MRPQFHTGPTTSRLQGGATRLTGAGTRRQRHWALFSRQLHHYPDTGERTFYLAITVLATVVLYYELYIQGAVSTKIIQEYGFSFTGFVAVLVVGNLVGAFASLAAGLADRWGRANIVIGGLLLTGLLIEFALPNASSRGTYMLFFALISIVEGAALVATPALTRDFSPQVGRGVAMAFWTMGPVLGSLVVTEVSSHTLSSHPAWQYQFEVCGIVGLAVWLIALLGLRELSPQLRDQLMVSTRDRALVEARAAGIDPRQLLRGQWRQMLRLDIAGPALAISVFLLLYYVFVAFLVVFLATVFGYSDARANSLGNWYWIANAVALLVAGVGSDLLRVRKPLMILGAAISLVGVGLFAATTTDPATGYDTFAAYFILMAAGGGIAFVSWMAAFTETIEGRNPAATATGLAVWGWILRITVTVAFAVLPLVVSATSTLVDQGPRVQQIVRTYPVQVRVLQTVAPETLRALAANPADATARAAAISQLSGATGRPALSTAEVRRVLRLATRYAEPLATAAALDPSTLGTLVRAPANQAALRSALGEIESALHVTPAQASARLQALAAVPVSDLAFMRANAPRVQAAAAELRALSRVPQAEVAYLQANATKVAEAKRQSPGQWQTWWWICFAAQVLFVPFVFMLSGRWSPARARQDDEAHRRAVERELARLRGGRA